MNLKSAIESILFVQGEPLAISRLVKITGAKRSGVEATLRELQGEYRERGVVLIANGEEWQFATHPGNKTVVEKLVTSELSEDLSRAALEALAIIAYKSPITRAGVEYIRGVDSSFTVRNLLMRGLVAREENPADRRSYLYRISSDFLKHLGLQRLGELPHYESFRRQDIQPPPEPPKL